MATSLFLRALGGLLLLRVASAQAQTFAPQVTYSCGADREPIDVAVADVNGDGKLDALVFSAAGFQAAGGYDGRLHVLLGNGRGGFALQPASASTGGIAWFAHSSMATADVNGDGKLDVLVTNYYSNTLGVLLGDGRGGFVLQAALATGGDTPTSVAVGDINGDGKPDVLVTNYKSRVLGVLLGDGKGNFALQANSPLTSPDLRSVSVALGDLNGDGKLDALVTNEIPNILSVLLGDGHGGFAQLGEEMDYLINSPRNLTIADVNKDGKQDALVVGPDQVVGVKLGDGYGGFSKPVNYYVNGNAPTHGLTLCDIDGDANLDVLTTCASPNFNSVGIMLGDGQGHFAATPTGYPQTGMFSSPNGVAVGDVNGDGKPDVLVANFGNSTLGVLLNGVALPTRAALPGVAVTLAPNPATSSATLRLTGLPATVAQVQVTLFDATGRAVRQQTLAVSQGSTYAEVATAGLAAGLYVLRLAAQNAQGQLAGGLPTQHLSVR